MSEDRPYILDIDRILATDVRKMRDAEFEAVLGQVFSTLQTDKKENSIYYYIPTCDRADAIHTSKAMIRFVAGGNRSGKTSSLVADAVALSTGVFPQYLTEKYPGVLEQRFRGPMNGRIVCQSLINVMEGTLLKKLQWWQWNGPSRAGGENGHWGFIPKFCLIDGDWDRSWNTKSRTLRYYCRDPENIDRIVGESSLSFFSYDQDLKEFTSAECHWVIMDEPPPLHIYQENKARIISANGWLAVGMTWPDDPSINVDWIFDELYEKGMPGPKKMPDYEAFELHMTDNRHLDQEAVAKHIATMDEKTKKVRVYGQHIRFSNRVHELFTEVPRTWCFPCGEDQPSDGEKCLQCGSTDITEYCHVEEFTWDRNWPVVCVLDPHPRKPHMLAWIGLTPYDDARWIACLEVKGDPTDVRLACEDLESSYGLSVVRRLIDPKMAAHPSSQTGHYDRSVLDEFDAAGLYFEPADSNADVAVPRLNEMLRPDSHTRRPRMVWHPRCDPAIYQFRRFMWGDWKIGADKGQKQKFKEKDDDYPAIGRYFVNSDSTFRGLMMGGQVVKGTRRSYPSAVRRG